MTDEITDDPDIWPELDLQEELTNGGEELLEEPEQEVTIIPREDHE